MAFGVIDERMYVCIGSKSRFLEELNVLVYTGDVMVVELEFFWVAERTCVYSTSHFPQYLSSIIAPRCMVCENRVKLLLVYSLRC